MTVSYLARDDGERIAYRSRPGRGPHVLFLPGFHSDMTGTKATHLWGWAEAEGRAITLFDYYGHGQSTGEFGNGTIGRWRADALAVIDGITAGPLVLVGSSMGGWIALLAAIARPARASALALIAPAPDFTEDLMWAAFTPEARDEIERTGFWMRPSVYEAPYPITRGLIVEGRNHLLLRERIPISCPVHILHGMKDADVPFERSLVLADRLASENVIVELIKSGDHRLSGASELRLLAEIVGGLAAGSLGEGKGQ